jgi:hypothetical protein
MSGPVARATNDPRRAAIEHAVRAAASALLVREISISAALASVASVMGGADGTTATPRELAAAGRQAHRDQVVAQIVEFERAARGRAAVSIVARQHAVDVRDPIEVESLTNKFRRWRRAEKRACARLPSPKPIKG